MTDDLKMPEGLTEDGVRAYNSIMGFMEARGHTYTGGCRAFYSPQEWKDRREEYGLNSVLIVVHDGGDLAPVFNYSYQCDNLVNAMFDTLKKVGLHSEPCTCWYTAIYNEE
jgi:hypothetical protein